MVRDLELTDLCLFTEASYTRHLTQADRHTPFQNSPMALEHFPSGSILACPGALEENKMESWIERQKNILDFTLSSLLRRKGKNAALVSVYTLMVFLLASVSFFTHSIKKEASLILQDAPEMIVQTLDCRPA